MAAALLNRPTPAYAAASLSITPITWNIIGLDSNDVNAGPNHFPVGARVCNTGDAPATNVTSAFVWDSANALINLRPGTLMDFNASPVPSLAPGACHDFYYEVQVTRNPAAYDTTRRYHITATADSIGTVSTPTPRELYVEHLISQSRNHVLDVRLNGTSVPSGGTMTLVVGQTYTIELDGSTATNGYEQLQSFINFPNTVFQVLSVSTTYSADTSANVSNPNDKLYGDGCKWENDPNSPYYRSCRDVGKIGGSVTVTYQVKILQVPGAPLTNPQPLGTLLYDFSGSSFHYNADFGTSARFAAVVDPSTLTIAKNFSPDPTNVNGVSALTFTVTNPNAAAVSGVSFTDVLPTSPGAMVVANPAGATINGCGGATFAPAAGAGSISFSNGTVAANSSCTVKVNVTAPAAGTYTNTSNHLFVGGTDTGSFATDTLTVNNAPPPPPPVCATLALWTFPTGFNINAPAPTTNNVASASAASGPGVTPVSSTNSSTTADGTASWGSNGNITTGATLDTANDDYFQFAVDTTGQASVTLSFDALKKTPNGPAGLAVFDSTATKAAGATEPNSAVFSNANALPTQSTWETFGSITVNSGLNPSGVTYFRIYAFNSGNTNSGSDLNLDNVLFTGCVTPSPATISKSFSPSPVAVGGTSTLTFTITNPNEGLALSGVAFNDALPAGVTVTSGSSSQCGGTLTRTAPGTLSFTGGTLAAGVSCTVTATVTVTTAGPHDNVSGFVSSTQGGTNTGPTGIATASITGILPPTIAKQFAPNPVLAGTATTLTFTLTNPNVSLPVSGVAFSDALPASPGAMVVAPAPAAATSGCGSPTFAPAAGSGSISFSGGMIAGGGTCIVTVNVVAPVAGTYANTSGPVSHLVNGSPVNGGTASDALTATPANPAIALLKQVGPTASGPWSSFLAAQAGGNVFYRFTVENIGNVPLSSVGVSDPQVSAASCTWPSPLPVASPTADPAATCVVGPVTAVSGTHSNTATASGTDGETTVTDTSTATYATTGLTLAKSVTETSFMTAGDVLHYSYLVTNSGFAALAGPVTVSDNKATASCPAVNTVGDLDNFLDPGESITCTATYMVTAGDVAAGQVTNTASASVDGANSNSDSRTVPLANLADVSMVKTLTTAGPFTAGQAISYTLVVANGGPSTATNVQVTDTPTNLTITNVSGSGCAALPCTIASLASGANTTINVTATINTAGAFDNSASANGTESDPNTSNNTDSTGNGGTASASADVSLVKTLTTAGPYSPGQAISYTLAVANAGPSTATNIQVTDTPTNLTITNVSGGGCAALPCTIASLASGANTTINVTATINAAGAFDNSASATATEPDPNTTNNTDNTGNGGTALSPPTIAKAFSPNPIAVGGVSTLTFTIQNPNAGTSLTGVAFTDSFPAGLQVAATPGAGTSGCGSPTFAPAAGNTSLSFSGGTVAASGTCTVTVNVTATTSGAKVNTTGNVTSTNGGTGNTGTDTLTVLSPPSIAKAFSPNPIAVGGVSTLTFTIQNPNAGTALTGVAFSDSFPAGLQVASTPNASTSGCGAPTFAPSDGNTSLSLSGGTIAASGTCTVALSVTATTGGAKVNTTGNVTSTNGGTGNTGTDTLTVISPPAIAKAFSPNPIAVGGVSTLTFTIQNPNAGTALMGVGFSDSFPAGLQVAATPNAATSGCGAPTFSPAAGNTSVSFSGGTVAASGTCTVTVNVTATTSGAKVNTTGNVTSTNGGTGNAGTDTLTVVSPPSIAKAFSPNPIAAGGVSTLTFSITNPNSGTALTGVAFSDSFPAGLQVAASPNASTGGCGSPTFAPAAGNTSLSFSGGTIAASGTCTVSVNVTATTSGAKVNTTGSVSSTNGGTGNTGTDTLVVLSAPGIAKAFSPNPIAVGGVSTLTFTVTNPNAGTPLTGVAFTDSFPAGLQVAATPSASTTGCGSPTFAPAAGNTSLSFSGGTVAASGTCTVTVNVTATTSGAKVNTTGSVTSTNGGTGNSGTDTLTVVSPPGIAKAFSPNPIAVGGVSTLTFTITNPNSGTSLTGVAFTDSFPAGLQVAATPNASTSGCGSPTFAPAAGNISLSFSGGTVAASGTCTVSVAVTATSSGAKANTTGNVTSTNGGTGNTASDTLTVLSPPSIAKAFSPNPIAVGGVSTLTFTITNPNSGTALSGVAFADSFPAGLQVAATPNASTTGCGSPTFAPAAGNTSLSFSGGTVAASGTCTVSVNVTPTTAGAKANTTGNVTSTNGGTGNTGTDTLTVLSPPGIAKAFSPNPVAVGGVSTLTFTITNSNGGTALTGVAFTDSFPAGLQVAATPSASTSGCGSPIFAPSAGNTSLSFSGGTIAASGTCTVTVNVTPTTPGSKVNTTGNVTSTNGGTGNTGTATLTTVTSPLSVTKAFGATAVVLNGTTSLTLSLNNTNAIPLTGVAVTDNLPAGLVVATPNGLMNTCGGTASAIAGSGLLSLSGGAIAANGSCTLRINVTGTTPGTKNNQTGAPSSNETGPGAPSNIASLTVNPFTVSITDPPVCLGSGGIVAVTATFTNGATSAQSAVFTAALPAGLVPLVGSCSASAGACAVTPNVTPATVNVNVGALGAGQTVTVTFQAQLGDVPTGTQLCINSQVVFGGGTPISVQACTTVNCPAVGPGLPYPSASEVSDQKLGSVLVYNFYSSNSAAPNTQNTRIAITNTHPSLPVAVHLFFVDGSSCSIADSLICLTAGQTTSFLASDVDPGTTGYIIAVASDRVTGCPINFNFLAGDEYVKLSSGHAANLAAESFAALAGGLPACDADSVTAVLNFDGVGYNRAPRALATSNLPSRADGNDTLLVLNRFGGSLVNGAAALSNVFGILYNDAETPLSFGFNPGVCQFRSSLSNNFPRVTPRFEQFILAGRSGWAKLFSLDDQGLLGAQINFNGQAGAAAGAFNQGHNLHKLTLTPAAQLILPIFPPNC